MPSLAWCPPYLDVVRCMFPLPETDHGSLVQARLAGRLPAALHWLPLSQRDLEGKLKADKIFIVEEGDQEILRTLPEGL